MWGGGGYNVHFTAILGPFSALFSQLDCNSKRDRRVGIGTKMLTLGGRGSMQMDIFDLEHVKGILGLFGERLSKLDPNLEVTHCRVTQIKLGHGMHVECTCLMCIT